MSLPQVNMPWPPAAYKPALDQVRRDLAWVTGDMDGIRDQESSAGPKPYQSRAQYNGGIVGATARGVLGKPRMDIGGNAKIERHLPVAAELVAVSANLLAEKPISATLHDDDAPTYNEEGELVGGNQRAAAALDALTSPDEFASEIWEAEWHQSAAGWVYGRIVWNQEVSPHPWLEFVDADQAYAEFQNGKQSAITFWDTYRAPDGGKATYRLLQRHAPGAIEYGLYEGTETELGMRVPVTDHPATAYLADLLDADSEIKTGTDLLTARMGRNLERNPSWRHDPTLRYYGRSDVQKAGGLWGDIDRAWSELWHEVESGRHRLLVSEDLMQVGAPGQGSYFEWMRDIFPVGQSGNADEPATIESVQAELRVDKHMAVVDAATRKAIDAVGLSPLTVGMDPQASGQMTATETRARSDKTIKTFGGKARQSRAWLSELLTAYLHMDAHLNGYQPPTRRVNVSIVEPVQDTDEDRANRALKLRQAEAASTRYLVRDLHPEWTPEEVDKEVADIIAERNAGMPADPFNVGADQSFEPEVSGE